MKKKVRRVGPSTKCLTQGKVYTIENNMIMGDSGSRFHLNNYNNMYWEDVTLNVDTKIGTYETEYPAHITADYITAGFIAETIKEENKMVDIKEVTLVNGKDSADLTVDDYIALITKEQDRMDTLANVGFISKAVEGIVAKHDNNVCALVKLMDKYHV